MAKVIEISQWEFERVSLEDLFVKDVLKAFQTTGDNQNICWIFDTRGTTKLDMESFDMILSRVKPKYIKRSDDYPRIAYIRGILEETETGWKIRILK